MWRCIFELRPEMGSILSNAREKSVELHEKSQKVVEGSGK